MKLLSQIILVLLCPCISVWCSAQGFAIDGHFSDFAAHRHLKVYLMKAGHLSNLFSGSNLCVIDSIDVAADGHFRYTNAALIEDNTFYRLNVVDPDSQNPGAVRMIGSDENFAFLLLTKNSNISFTTSVTQVGQQLRFSKADNANFAIQELALLRRDYCLLIDSLVRIRMAMNKSMSGYEDSLQAINSAIRDAGTTSGYYDSLEHFVDTVAEARVSILALQYMPDDLYADLYRRMSRVYSKRIPGDKYQQQFKAAITGESVLLRPGTKAPDIVLPDMDGMPVSLSTWKGGYVLVDFWASWCAPCRAENKDIVMPLYARFRDKGFTVLSVSLDISREKWIAAITKDALPLWQNVCDLKGMASGVVSAYNVNNLPCNYLIGPDGTIVATDMHGEKLAEYVSRLMK